MALEEIRQSLKKQSDKRQAKELQRFFKTGPGEYGEGDLFIGVKVPDIRRVAGKYRDVKFRDISRLLRSPVHEERFLALVFLVRKYSRGDEKEKKKIYDFYLANTRHINNWDLVDTSAGKIVGAHLVNRDRSVLYSLSRSGSIWERRISIIATSHFIWKESFETTLEIAENLLNDEEDLIHKAVGWMLREIGKRHLPSAESFLKRHYRKMPRVMLRYAIERYPEPLRKKYLNGVV